MTFHGMQAVVDNPVAGEPAPHDDAHPRAAYGPDTHLHDPSASMAIPLLLLAWGAVLVGYLGLPLALGGTNLIEHFLDPSFHPGVQAAGGTQAAGVSLQLTLLAASGLVALAGITLGAVVFLRRPALAGASYARFTGLHRVLLNKYYVDEAYEALFVRPINLLSERGLWRGVDVRLVDGAVNGTAVIVQAAAGTLRRLQSGAVRVYAAAFIMGVVLLLGYLLWSLPRG